MRKVILNMRELERYEIIKKLYETNGNKKRAAIKLGVSLRHVNRLINIYKSEGKHGFVHKNKGRIPANKIDEHIKESIINLYINDYYDANIKHFSEIVLEDLDLKISNETIRSWLLSKQIISCKAHKKTKNKIKMRYKEMLKTTGSNSKANEIKIKIEEVDSRNTHPRKERCKYEGEMIQMDASRYEWIKGFKWYLHLAVDDASGKVVGAYFDEQETLNGYYHVLKQILSDYGIPNMFYTDRRTVFEYKHKNIIDVKKDTFTQFSYACYKLGIEIKTTSVPQTKGRIERLNSTFQSRLPIELRRANVETIEEANIFLTSYLQKYNEMFALQLHTNKSIYESQPDERKINNLLSVLSVRTIDHGNCIKYNNKVYMPMNNNGSILYLNEGIKVIMIETFDNKLLINIYDNIYTAFELKKHKTYSKEFDDDVVIKNPIENTYEIPKISPWRYDDFLGFLTKQKHRQNNNKICANI